jgi:2-polyprenyl-3-methyl-5-hydroxy-6-metoxy-1,4-benzoquinol methylase
VHSPLVRMIGFPATLIHGDTLVLDRWTWLRKRLPAVAPRSVKLLDVGCGQGAFTIGLARDGYDALGLTGNSSDNRKATERAAICGADLARFEALDIRNLDSRHDFLNQFDILLCLEVIEHILNDQKLMVDMARCVRPGGKLLLTTPNFDYRPMTKGDAGPFSPVENGWHVRKGYTEKRLRELSREAGLEFESISYCSGFVSQKVTAIQRWVTDHASLLIGWTLTLPLRPLPPLLDPIFENKGWPPYSICMEAHRPAAGVPS